MLIENLRSTKAGGSANPTPSSDPKVNAAESSEASSKAAHRRFFEIFHAKLPREVRDLVYHYVHSTSEPVRVFAADLDEKTGNLALRHAPLHQSFAYWNADYVGNDVRRELIETFYGCRSFIFAPTFNYPSSPLRQFLETDQCQMGMPPSSFVTNVHLVVDISIHSDFSEQIDTTQKLEGLLGLKTGAKICIEFRDFVGNRPMDWPEELIRETLKEAYYTLLQLREAGSQTKVSFALTTGLFELNLQNGEFEVDAWIFRYREAEAGIFY